MSALGRVAVLIGMAAILLGCSSSIAAISMARHFGAGVEAELRLVGAFLLLQASLLFLVISAASARNVRRQALAGSLVTLIVGAGGVLCAAELILLSIPNALRVLP